jgi:zinc transport system ATP-binding protein
MDALISCENLALGYEGKLVLDGLNFSVPEGGRLCVVGENGSGKSTLLKALLGLISVMGGELKISPRLKPSDSGYLPQESAAQKDFPASVWEAVLSGRQNKRGLRPFYGKVDKEAAAEKLALLGIADLRNSCFRELSGGQRRRALLARALCAAEKLLVLDEPAAGLDPLVQEELYRVLDRVNREQGIAVVMVSHDIEGVLQFAEGGANEGSILHLARRQEFFGTVDEYRESEVGSHFLCHYRDDGEHQHEHPTHLRQENADAAC